MFCSDLGFMAPVDFDNVKGLPTILQGAFWGLFDCADCQKPAPHATRSPANPWESRCGGQCYELDRTPGGRVGSCPCREGRRGFPQVDETK